MSTQPEPDAIALFGIPFHDLTLARVLEDIDRLIESREPGYIVTPNLDFAAQASRDAELHRIILGAYRILCDGMPLVWSSRLLGSPLRERVAGSDLVPLLAEHAATQGYRLYFLGSSGDVLEQARVQLEAQFPGLQVCGMDSPPHAPLEKMDHASIAAKIREARPEILLVAFGCPKQEKWIRMHYRSLAVPCSIGIGASLDFVAGKTRRAPVWMRKTGTEWIFRLLQEPGRLLGRYAGDFRYLLTALARHGMEMTSSACPAGALGKEAWKTRELPGGLELDLSGTPRLDAYELGRLLRLYYQQDRAGKSLVLLNCSESVKHLLKISNLDRLLEIK